MAAPTFDNDKAARCLIEANLLGNRKAAEKYGVTTRTIRNWKKRLETDAEFSALYLHYVEVSVQPSITTESLVVWGQQLDETLSVFLTKMQEVTVGLEPTPEALDAIARAFAAVGELHTAREVLSLGDHNDAKQDGPPEETGVRATPDFGASYN